MHCLTHSQVSVINPESPVTDFLAAVKLENHSQIFSLHLKCSLSYSFPFANRKRLKWGKILLIHTLQINILKSLIPRDRLQWRTGTFALPHAGFIIIPGKSRLRGRNADAALCVAMIHTLYMTPSWNVEVLSNDQTPACLMGEPPVIVSWVPASLCFISLMANETHWLSFHDLASFHLADVNESLVLKRGANYVMKWMLSRAVRGGMVTHSSILAWRIPRTLEPGGLQSMGWQRIRHDCVQLTLVSSLPLMDFL